MFLLLQRFGYRGGLIVSVFFNQRALAGVGKGPFLDIGIRLNRTTKLALFPPDASLFDKTGSWRSLVFWGRGY